MKKTYPPSIISTQPGSWAYSTVKDRLPEIAGRVIEENQFDAQVNASLSELQEEIPNKPIRHLLDKEAPDHQFWQGFIKPYLGKNWLVVPWFFTETYFYRRIMEAVHYFELYQDPFSYQKEQGLKNTREDIIVLAAYLDERLRVADKVERTLRDGLYFSLWANQADLSLWPADGKETHKQTASQRLQDQLLADDIKPVIKALWAGDRPKSRVDIMLDNAGFEFVSDLALVDILLSHQLVEQVVLHVKAHPTFVSDVIMEDIDQTIDFLMRSGDESTIQFGTRIRSYLEAGQIEARSDFFWNSPLALWDLPRDLRKDLESSSLLISKGDANYRRILGDRDWDFTTPFHKAVDYLPVPLAALRTSKAEIAVGLSLDQIQFVFNQDSKWMVDGKWGMIQYSPARNSE